MKQQNYVLNLFKVNNIDTRTTQAVFIFDFEQVNVTLHLFDIKRLATQCLHKLKFSSFS